MLEGKERVCQHWCRVGHDTDFWNKALTFLLPSPFEISSVFNIFNITVNGYVARHLQRQCITNGKWLKNRMKNSGTQIEKPEVLSSLWSFFAWKNHRTDPVVCPLVTALTHRGPSIIAQLFTPYGSFSAVA